MQVTSSQKRRVAVFFIAGVVFMATLIIFLVGNKLLKREDCYYSNFENISIAGLTEGASVKFQGMNIGYVSSISIDNENTSVVKINFCLKPDVPIKEGTKSQLGNIGITGLKFLELQGGGKGKNIDIGGEIPSEKSSWDEISGKATVITAKIESILNMTNSILKNVDQQSLENILKNVSGITESIDIVLRENRTKINSITDKSDKFLSTVLKNRDKLTKILNNIAALTNKEGPIFLAFNSLKDTSDEAKDRIANSKIDENFQKLYSLLDSLQKTMDTINLTVLRSQEDITSSFEELNEAMSNFNEFTRIIMENPSAIIKGGEGDTK